MIVERVQWCYTKSVITVYSACNKHQVSYLCQFIWKSSYYSSTYKQLYIYICIYSLPVIFSIEQHLQRLLHFRFYIAVFWKSWQKIIQGFPLTVIETFVQETWVIQHLLEDIEIFTKILWQFHLDICSHTSFPSLRSQLYIYSLLFCTTN